MGFPGSSVLKLTHLSMLETQVWSPGREDPLEKEMSWENPMDRA